MKKLHIKRNGSDAIVHSIPVKGPTRNKVETILKGLLRNMSDDFHVDASEFDYLYQKEDA